ncbi:MAG: FRG domain-containing protein [Methanomicrobia archaeon]|nr:FRG domain-containing protein [Methanomicrobia archaeon]
MTQIDTFDELKKLAEESEKSSLGDCSPRKDQEFYLFRGTKECYPLLMSSIQVYLSVTKKVPCWKNTIQKYERNLVNRFLKEIEPYRELNLQYHWYCPPCPRTDTFWYLSVMQHFGCPTRLCDFTADFWTAVFFATVNAEPDKNPCLYRLKCCNNDKSGNKLPKDCNGKPWSNNGEKYDVNELLGYIIRYEGFTTPSQDIKDQDIKDRLMCFCKKTKKSQMYGWDTPYFKNARIQKQRAFFVYGVDVTTPLEESIVGHSGTDFQKYQISANILPDIKSHLEEMGLIEWKVYLDLDRVFKKWKSE